MNNFKTFCFALAVLGFARAEAAPTPIEIRGNFSYQTLNNNTQVRIEVESLVNTSQTQTSGTLHLQLFATQGPSPVGTGYTLADSNLATFVADTGRLGPNRMLTGIVTTVPLTLPPNGTWYVHLIVVEFPNLNTILDSGTFTNRLVVGTPTPPPPVTPPPVTPPPVTPPPRDDHGDTFGSATALTAGLSRDGRLDFAGDIDMFMIRLNETSRLDAFTESLIDTVGRLYDANGALIVQIDDVVPRPDPANLNFAITRELPAGTYYVAVMGYNGQVGGAYRVRANVTAVGVPMPPPPVNPPPVVTPPPVTPPPVTPPPVTPPPVTPPPVTPPPVVTPPVTPPPVVIDPADEGGGGATSLPMVLALSLLAMARTRRGRK